jgi:histidine triad (HIT) family protein
VGSIPTFGIESALASPEEMDASCLVCRELQGEVILPGGLVSEDELTAAFHAPPLEEIGNPRPYLGHLFVVTRRHVARFGELTDEEAAAVGRAAARLAAALTDAGGADWVYSAVIGTRTPHFHLHLLPRYPETPRDLPWYSTDEWEGARRGGSDEIIQLTGRLKAALAARS